MVVLRWEFAINPKPGEEFMVVDWSTERRVGSQAHPRFRRTYRVVLLRGFCTLKYHSHKKGKRKSPRIYPHRDRCAREKQYWHITADQTRLPLPPPWKMRHISTNRPIFDLHTKYGVLSTKYRPFWISHKLSDISRSHWSYKVNKR